MSQITVLLTLIDTFIKILLIPSNKTVSTDAYRLSHIPLLLLMLWSPS